MMIACGDFVIPGNKMPPNNAEAEAAYAIFIDMIENGWLTVSSESLVAGKTRIRWELLKEQETVVRCVHCKRRGTYDCPVYVGGDGMHSEPDDWFCADGKRG